MLKVNYNQTKKKKKKKLQPNWKHKAFQLNSHLHKELLNCESVFFIAMTKITAE